ncbi:hypothetical protein DPMN_139313 [Dreissena polymorpha]|uniref:Uncharacterized protein n=1 Tax=Dreissena polymorpha TaxID=45954 RepID=A0A9D4G8B8_DREPO|nr:hypothetical protein DPMN_139313 [Dreissena polymorpha]
MPEVPVGARLMHFAIDELQITSDAWVHSLVTQGPHFSIRKKAPTSFASNRSGISASTTSRLHLSDSWKNRR